MNAPRPRVWLYFGLPHSAEPAAVAAHAAVLDDEERRRMARFFHPDDGHLFGFSHIMLRRVLARHVPAPAERLEFVEGEHGRPELRDGVAGLSFNLSHTRGVTLVGVSVGGVLGVDVEQRNKSRTTDAIARRFFSPAEADEFFLISDAAERFTRFFHLWSLKEALLKARGTGLTTPLSAFTYRFPGPGALTLEFEPRLNDDAKAWHASLLETSSEFAAAFSLRAPQAPALEAFTWSLPDLLTPRAVSVLRQTPPAQS